MKKTLLACFSTVMIGSGAIAQCSNTYIAKSFANIDSATVTYSTTNQKMVIFWPTGDVSTSRPLLVMAHGGSFLGGDRFENTSYTLAKNFAQRGYVTATIDYRLAASALDMLNNSTAYPVVVKAISDAKAAVRYFSKDAATTNTYKVDTNRMYFGGNSAGSIIGVQYAYIDDTTELDASLRSVMNSNGGIEGNSGNAGYTSKIKAILNLAGGILDTAWIADATEQPVASFHGDADGTVPYNCGRVLGGVSQITLCGSGVMVKRLNNVGVQNVLVTFLGDDHVPWESSPTKFAQVDSVSADFLARRMCNNVGFKEIDKSTLFSVYPNPATESINVNFEGAGQVATIELIDALGRTFASINPTLNNTTIATNNISNGIYFVKATLKDKSTAIRAVQISK